jgi:hypothetical protein
MGTQLKKTKRIRKRMLKLEVAMQVKLKKRSQEDVAETMKDFVKVRFI